MKRFFAAFFIFSACAGTSVSTAYDHQEQFKNRKTFSFAPGLRHLGGQASSNPQGDEEAMLVNSIVRKDLRTAVSERLRAKGLQEVKVGGDLTVAYYINAKRKTSLQRSEPQIGWDYGYGFDPGYNYGFVNGQPAWEYGYTFAPIAQSETLDMREYEEGTIIIDMYDATTKRLVWRGRGIREIANTQDANSFKVQQTVKKILSAFPPS